MTPRNDMDTADPQATDTLEATSGNGTFVSGGSASSTHRSRRAIRIAVSLPVVVRDQFGGREETRTQFVMVRGAVIATTSNIRVGHKLTVQIAKTGRAAECTVTSVEPDGHSAEVEFTREQSDFWPVQFPPEDLKTDSGSYRLSAPAQSGLASRPSSFADTARHETRESPLPSRGSNEFVSLADSIAGNSLTGNSFGKAEPSNPEKFRPRSAPVDSVAQFRAANRAAHRREQRTKFMYSILSLAAVAAALMGARYWMEHRSEIAEVKLPQMSLPSISQVQPKSKPSEKPTTPAPSVREQPSAETVATAPAPRTVETPHSTHVPVSSETPAQLVAPPVPPEVSQPAETQVAVRHEAASASARKAVTVEDAGEEPSALPLKVDDNSSPVTKPEVLNEVVAQTPMKAALLAPQPARKAVPAKLLQSAPAQYPAMARQIRVEGEVVISLDVDTSGKVSAARAVSGPPILRTAALDAVKRWKYQPATLGDQPVVSTEVVKVQFKLR